MDVLLKGSLSSIIEHLEGVRVLVVGDLMLDRYLSGDAVRISPEAPVPVVLVEDEWLRAGGAANVAMNLAALGAKVDLVGTFGDDTAGSSLFDLLTKNGIKVSKWCRIANVKTIVKTRVVARMQQICRIDNEGTPAEYKLNLDLPTVTELDRAISECDAVILSDYAKGVVTQNLYDQLVEICNRQNKLLAVDPKPSRRIDFQGAGLMTPNRKEAMELAELTWKSNDSAAVEEACDKICKKYRIQRLVITLGSDGMVVYQSGQVVARLPTVAREVFDVSGAGDTVIATIVAAMATGSSLVEAARLGNIAAGIVVGKFGTAVSTKEELFNAVQNLSNAELHEIEGNNGK